MCSFAPFLNNLGLRKHIFFIVSNCKNLKKFLVEVLTMSFYHNIISQIIFYLFFINLN